MMREDWIREWIEARGNAGSGVARLALLASNLPTPENQINNDWPGTSLGKTETTPRPVTASISVKNRTDRTFYSGACRHSLLSKL